MLNEDKLAKNGVIGVTQAVRKQGNINVGIIDRIFVRAAYNGSAAARKIKLHCQILFDKADQPFCFILSPLLPSEKHILDNNCYGACTH